jgi:MFS family permease
MTNYSVIFYFQEVMGSEALSGLGFGLCFGPPLILGWFAGVACDRMNPFKLIGAATAVFMVSNLIFAWIAAQEPFVGRELAVLGCAALAGVGWSFVSPARMTALRWLTPLEQLPRSTLLFNVLVMLGFGLGPLAISGVRATFDWTVVLTVSATLFLLSALLLIRIPVLREFANSSPWAASRARTVWGDIREGLQALRSSTLIQQLMACALIGFMFMGPIQVIVPKLAVTTWGLAELGRGALLGVLAPSFIAGGALCMWAVRVFRPPVLIFSSLGIAGVAFLGIGFQAGVFWVPALLALVGIFGGLAQSQIVTLIQSRIEDRFRGRISGIYTMSSQVVPAMSGVGAGLLVSQLGPQTSLQVWGAGLLVLICIYLFTMRTLRAEKF